MSQVPEYRVLARKYRPKNFDELIGQEALVRTLSNAIESGRLAHAFILTGVRGIGKTTTARIIARALNCEKGPTTNPCGTCANCIAIAEDRHVDVLEMDAASNTGVDDVREIIDSVKYAPASARYKVYIIDEVHMLSKNAFNALLKTLEEPPPHVKFVFATTEIRKVPITVLSRCQRFDLRRVSQEVLTQHFTNIANKESWAIDDAAAALIAKAADGSVRDGLSILDHAGALGEGKITYDIVARMLGLADGVKTNELFTQILSADSASAIETLNHLYDHGADPVQVVQDLLDLCHQQTRQDLLGEKAQLGRLTRLWQVLLKGLSEVVTAPHPLTATEMLMVRAAHVSGLPTPAELVEKLYDPNDTTDDIAAPANASSSTAVPVSSPARSSSHRPAYFGSTSAAVSEDVAAVSTPSSNTTTGLATFEDIVALAEGRKEAVLHTSLFYHIHPVSVSVGHLEIALGPQANKDLPNRLSKFLRDETGRPWMVTVSTNTSTPTLAMRQQTALDAVRQEAEQSPAVKAILLAFPGSNVIDIEPKE